MREICGELHQLFNNLERFRIPFDESKIPLNGIYVLFEAGEKAHGRDRIVRIGTHTGDNQLRSRFQQHFIDENKDRSIFRKNIGRALLNGRGDMFLKQWELDLTSRKDREKYGHMVSFKRQARIEKTVTEYIQNQLSFVVFQVDNKEERLSLESKMISTVSLCKECGPSRNWLGLSSPKTKTRESGLWLVNELFKKPLTENDLKKLKQLCRIG